MQLVVSTVVPLIHRQNKIPRKGTIFIARYPFVAQLLITVTSFNNHLLPLVTEIN